MNRFTNFMPELIDVARRFPVPVLCSAAMLFATANYERGFGNSLTDATIVGFAAAFLAGGSAHLFSEQRKGAFLPSLALAAILAGAAGYIAFKPEVMGGHLLFLFLALILLLFVAPFLRADVRQGAVWLFGMRLGLAALLAFVVGMTLILGLLAVLNGLEFLFGFDFGNTIQDRIFAFCIYVVAPFFGLAMVPRDVNEEIELQSSESGLLDRGVSILVNYITVPLSILYAVLLHAYAAKIILLQSMPKGEVGTVVTMFAIAGTMSWLLAWPFRESGTRLLKFYCRFWFWFLPVPIVLLALAVWQRIDGFGVTPDRYGLILVAFWALLVCGYLALRRSFADMRIIIGGAAVLLLFGSFGPQGAVFRTESSQFARLEKFLAENDMLENGKLKVELPKLANAAKEQGHSLLRVLFDVNALPRALALLPDGEKLTNGDLDYLSSDVAKRFGVEDYAQDETIVSFSASVTPISFPFVGDGRVLGPFQYVSYATPAVVGLNAPTYVKNNGKLEVKWLGTNDAPSLAIMIDERDVLQQFSALTIKAPATPQLPKVIDVDAKTTLIVMDGSGRLSDTTTELQTLTFWVIAKN